MCPPLLMYSSDDEYKDHYREHYCKTPLTTFDGIPVFFRSERFYHCFYESAMRNGVKNVFSRVRAERMDWIRATLTNPKASIFKGWDRKKKRYYDDSRVAVVYESFVVVIRLSIKKDGSLKGNFITCYQADNSISKIKSSPLWSEDDFRKNFKRRR